jgi:transposase
VTEIHGKYAGFEGLREQAITLRREGLSLRQIRDRLKVHNNDILNRLVKGEPAPEWTKRPNAKDDLREKARELRLKGMTYDQIQVKLGCSKGSISLWVRDLPKPPKRTPEQASAIAKRGWEATLQKREEERQKTKQEAFDQIGQLSDRELLIAGVTLYWAEGCKDKSYARRESLKFINSDPNVIKLYLRWLDLLQIPRERLRFAVSIHESADVPAAEQFWAEIADVSPEAFHKANLKRHNPKTVRKNTGEAYRGCLTVYVTQSAELYRRMEGTWYGIVGAASASDRQNRT